MSHITLKSQLSDDDRKSLSRYGDLEAHLLFHRGITSNEDAEAFMNPKYDQHSHSPESLAGISEAVTRVLAAIASGEKICIYSDYDADGIPGAVILSDFFEKIGYTNFFVYIPHRNREGFGLNVAALDSIKDNGASLVITIDCGSANVREVEHAKAIGLDVIITDHHEMHENLPDALAVINPKRSDCAYPEKMLCGSGVIFKFVSHILREGKFDIVEGWEKWLLDMVGIATISDMVPLVGENRTLAYYGLRVLKLSRRPGLLKIFDLKNINQKLISADDISFLVTPKINAASRMGEPILAYNLLKSKTEEEADAFARELIRINDRRKVEVALIVKEIHKHIKERPADHPVIAYGNPNWQPSLLGLAASKVAEDEMKPVFLWGRGDGVELKGSCRGYGDISVFELMSRLDSEFFIQYGGHQGAGGFVIRPEKVSLLEAALAQHVSGDRQAGRTYECDLRITADEITGSLVDSLELLAPYGMGNPKPLFLIEGIVQSSRNFGSQKNHFEISLAKGRGTIRAIAFFKTADSYAPLEAGQKVGIVGHVERNFFAGRQTVQIRLVDVVA